MTSPQIDADTIIRELDLEPHPEGGAYREMFRDVDNDAGRSHGTAIYYLLKASETSAWHRVDAVEIWHWYAGAPLALSQRTDAGPVVEQVLGTDIVNGARPQLVVPSQMWQTARSLGPWTLVGCTVAPGFEFSGFEMARSDRF